MRMPCCWTTHSRVKPVTPLTNGAIDENQLFFDEVKAYKNYTKFLGHPDVIPAGCDSYLL